MTPRRVALLTAVGTAAAWFAVASALDVRPGRPMATRTDVFFQSDAGGIIRDAVTDNHERARGTHPLLYPAWTAPLHATTEVLSFALPPEVTATYGSRILVNGLAALGVGVLAAGLVGRGVRPRHLLAAAPVFWFGTGQTLSAIPDHFGVSVGVLSASFGVYAGPGRYRLRAAALVALTAFAFGVTVTNAAFPAALLAVLTAATIKPRWYWYAAVLVLGLFAAGGFALWLDTRPDIRSRIDERVGMYLTWTLTKDPGLAARRAFRGVVDTAVGSTPAITSDNLDRLPMLTYQPRGRTYELWPYGPFQSVAAVAWLAVLGVGSGRALRDASARLPASLLLAWAAANAAFHNVWGDEYFLYSPHSAWALVTAAVLGWRGSPAATLAVPCGVAAAGGIATLVTFRRLLLEIPE